jgi:FkbM family methyltransferase
VDCVLDVGANEGQFAELIRRLKPQAQIYCFEPLPAVAQTLIESFKGDSRLKVVNVALGDEDGDGFMFSSSFSPSSSLLPMTQLHRDEWPESAGQERVAIKKSRLDTWLAESGAVLGENLLLKMDVQGFEAAVIDGGSDVLRRTRIAVVEVSFYPLYEGQPLFNDIHRRMTALGFEFRGNIDQHYSRKQNRILFADAVYERRTEHGNG